MRYFFFGLLGLVIACSPETAPSNQFAMQNTGPVDQVVMEVNNEKPAQKFQDVIQYLKDQGFRPHLVNHKSYHIQTAYKPFEEIGGKGKSYIRISASVENGSVQFSGQISGDGFKEIEIRKSEKDLLLRKAWHKLTEIAEGYSQQNAIISENDSRS